ncbi:hypothetical protein DZA28_00715 [Pseudomonas alloputida]|uniref:Diguanylate cyclase n=1 Tax=Pseudomonas alloputida TaxID=1940621 RepID=A0ABY3CYW2_9PSED|nr:hypothetical protein CHN49_00165 [Pseudomonas putida]TRZ58545.1 hypothetical protein DZA28_00715 [Pseudomonas alloputida]
MPWRPSKPNCNLTKQHTNPVGAGAPANTGEAGAKQRVGFFAGMPAPTGLGDPLRIVDNPCIASLYCCPSSAGFPANRAAACARTCW